MYNLLIFKIISLFIFVYVDERRDLESTNKNIIHQENVCIAYFASGCFWCVESIYEDFKGVISVSSGYAGGYLKNPTYRQVIGGKTGHAETVKVTYNPSQISFSKLVEIFFLSHDPTTKNRQGPDIGSHYRSIAFYENEYEKEIIKNYIDVLNLRQLYKNKIVTEIKQIEVFYEAEEYHQNFKKKNPNNPYILNVSNARIKKFKTQYPFLFIN